MALAAGVAEQRIQPGLFLLLVGRAERLVVDCHQAGHVAVAGFNDLLGRGQPRAGLAQPVAHGVVRVLGGAQLGGQRAAHQRLGLSGREGGSRLVSGRGGPGQQQEEGEKAAHMIQFSGSSDASDLP